MNARFSANIKKRFDKPQQSLFDALQNCETLAKLSLIHAQLIVHGFAQKNYLLSKLLYLYVSYGHSRRALTVAEGLRDPSTTVWNQIIRAHSFTETPLRSLDTFKRMALTDSVPDGFTFSFLLAACARSTRRDGAGEQVHARVLAGGFCSSVFVQTNLVNFYSSEATSSTTVDDARKAFEEMSERNLVSWNALLKGYARRGDLSGAWRVFAGMPEKSIVTWTTMVSGSARNGMYREALSMFEHMRKSNFDIDDVALVAALSACAAIGDLALGRSIHLHISEAQRESSVSLSNALIHMYTSCGEAEKARQMFEEMTERNAATWTAYVTGLAKLGRATEALEAFHRMPVSEPPNEATLVGVLSACSRSGLVDAGLEVFEHTTRTGVDPRVEHHGCLVDLLSRAGFLDAALRVIEAMPVEPGEAVWGSLLNGCRVHGDVELGTKVFERLMAELEHYRAAGYLMLLSNMYAAAQKWDQVAMVRRKMEEMGIKKPAGRSWIHIEGVNHEFIAGDVNHSSVPKIRKIIFNIFKQCQLETRELEYTLSLQGH